MEKFSTFFIHRPIAATLLVLAVILSGGLAYGLLPIAPLPQIDMATIQVRAQVPGAAPEVMASTVATPLERSLGAIAGVNEITSTSSLGSTNITLQFDLSRDINGAANDVQSALNATQSSLPAEMRTKPTYRKMNPANAPIAILALQSDSLSRGQLYDLANNVLLPRVLQLPGVGDVTVGGSSPQAVRVDLNPEAIAKMGVSLNSIITAIGNANPNLPQGRIEGATQSWQVQSDSRTRNAQDFLPLIVSYKNGNAVRLSDIAAVTDTVQNPLNMGMVNKKPAILMIVTSAPNANIIATIDRLKGEMPMLQGFIPANVSLNMAMERSATIRGSIRDVERALVLSLGLVIMVVYLFLRRWRATLIPSVAIPVSLIGTFAVMYAAGFSLNNLSLMSLTIATGFVVDDAIVVLENVSRHIEEGMLPMQAAFKGAHEIGFTVLSMSISLISVFIPFLGMSDLVGRFFREFALTLTSAIVLSMLMSLTVTPMMCARGLRPYDALSDARENRVLRWFGRFTTRIEQAYSRRLEWALDHMRLMLLVLLSAVVLTVVLFVALPKGFFPEQDTGRVNAQIRIDQSASFEANQTQILKAMNIISQDPAVAEGGVSGFVSGQTARMFIVLKPLSQRSDRMKTVLARLRGKTSNLSGADVLFSAAQDINIGGRPSAAAYQYTLQSESSADLSSWGKRLTQALSELPQMKDVNTDQQSNGIETRIAYDKDAMIRQGITVRSVDSALYAAFGPRLVGQINDPLGTRQVLLGVPLSEAQNASSLDHIFVLNNQNAPIPLSAFAHWENGKAPVSINHQSGTPAGTVSFNLAEGASLSDAQKLIEQTRLKIGMPDSVRGSFAGAAKAYAQNQSQQGILIVIVLICVYIVLGVLYESFIHPLTILSTIPSASLGALAALWLTGGQFDLIGLIGILLLIGLVKKNAIMMIDYALKAQRDGQMSARAAITHACRLRFRPILMTSLAAIFGAIPLALGHGDGAELRQPLGIAMVGGLMVSQMLTLFTTPVIFIYFDRIAARWHPFHSRDTLTE